MFFRLFFMLMGSYESSELFILLLTFRSQFQFFSVMDSLSAMNNRDIFFRKKNEKQDIPADTQLETLK